MKEDAGRAVWKAGAAVMAMTVEGEVTQDESKFVSTSTWFSQAP